MQIEQVSDNQLVRYLKLKNSDAFEELVRRYSPRVFSLVYRMTQNSQDSEEAMQDTFINVYRKVRNFEGKSSLSSWIYRIAVNSALMKLRKRRSDKHCLLEDRIPDYKNCNLLSDHSYKLQGENLAKEIERAIMALPLDYRNILVLREIDGLSTKEVSEILDLSSATIKSRLHRARLILRDYLKEYLSSQAFSANQAA